MRNDPFSKLGALDQRLFQRPSTLSDTVSGQNSSVDSDGQTAASHRDNRPASRTIRTASTVRTGRTVSPAQRVSRRWPFDIYQDQLDVPSPAITRKPNGWR